MTRVGGKVSAIKKKGSGTYPLKRTRVSVCIQRGSRSRAGHVNHREKTPCGADAGAGLHKKSTEAGPPPKKNKKKIVVCCETP